jgi:hypothetical protein
MSGGREDLRDRAGFHNAPGIHHRDAVSLAGHHAEVMRDEHHPHPLRRAQIAEQVEDLRLHRDIERRGRLIRDQHAGAERDGHGDQHALPHAARELMRVVIHAARRIGDLHPREQRYRPLPRRAAADGQMGPQHLGDLLAHGEDRVEAGQRVLENHADARTAPAAQFRWWQGQQILALEQRLAGDDAAGLGQQAKRGGKGDRLARAALADDCQRFSGADGKRDVLDQAHRALFTRDSGGEAAEFEGGGHSSLPVLRRICGSSVSRSPSPSRFSTTTV